MFTLIFVIFEVRDQFFLFSENIAFKTCSLVAKPEKCVLAKNNFTFVQVLITKMLLQIRPRFLCPHSTCRWYSVTNRAENICFITWRSKQFLLEWWPLLTCPRPYEKAPHTWSRYTIPSVPLLHSTLSALLLISSCHQISLFRPCLRSVLRPLYRHFPGTCLLLFTLSYLC